MFRLLCPKPSHFYLSGKFQVAPLTMDEVLSAIANTRIYGDFLIYDAS